MLFFPIKNYDEFVEMFGCVKNHSDKEDVKKNRRNKLVLTCWKDKTFFSQVRKYGKPFPKTASGLMRFAKMVTENTLMSDKAERCYRFDLLDWTMLSNQYQLDDLNGVCEDGDATSIRYINVKTNRVYKMNAGKFFTRCLEFTSGDKLPKPLITYSVEVLVERWVSAGNTDKYELVVGDGYDDFEKIYTQSYLKGNFHSCMVNKEYHSFYANSVIAKAAYLIEDESGLIVARCIIFPEVRDDDTNEVVRLAERQYSTDTDLKLQRILITKLIAGGYIDGYKKIGAGCSDSNAFVSNTGEDWSDRDFSIWCNVDDLYDGPVSYQDSFKGYDSYRQRAYNYKDGDSEYDLATTSGSLIEGEWDDWHECYCAETRPVYVHGRRYECDVNDLEDFVLVEDDGEYHHFDDCFCCSHCGDWYLCDGNEVVVRGNDYYCCEECMKRECFVDDFFTGERIDPEIAECEDVVVEINGVTKWVKALEENIPTDEFEWDTERQAWTEIVKTEELTEA
jgi:hypothetical protein